MLRIGVPDQDAAVDTIAVRASKGQQMAHAFPELTYHAPPKARAKDAVDEDWPCFLGSRRDSKSRETKLLRTWPDGGPKLVWEMRRGDGYASPVFADGRMVYVHRIGNEMHVDCQDPETGKRHWRFSYPCTYRQERYIRNAGQRSTPVIAGGKVYVHGVGGMLHCLDLASGKPKWKRDLAADFKIGNDYFGAVSSPLVYGKLLIQNLGGESGHTVAAFDRETGALVWGAGSKWGASCASPTIGKRHGEDRVFVLAGGMSRPPTGGLIVVDPKSGKIDFEYPFRSKTFESVNGSPPVVGNDWVFISASYGVGSAILALDDQGGFEQVWRTRSLGLQFQNALVDRERIFCIEGNSQAGALVCIEGKTGELRYRHDLDWNDDVSIDGKVRSVAMSVGEGSLLQVDGALLCLGDRGHLLRIEADGDGAKVTDRAWLMRAQESWTPPVVHKGLLYLCQNKTESIGDEPQPPRLLCYDLRAPQ